MSGCLSNSLHTVCNHMVLCSQERLCLNAQLELATAALKLALDILTAGTSTCPMQTILEDTIQSICMLYPM